MAEFVPLDGPEVIEALLADIRAALESRHDMFGKHLTYPRVDWTFQVDFDFYHTQEMVTVSGSQDTGAPALGTVENFKINKRRKVHAPDQVREELLGKQPCIAEDKGESANALSSPQSDGFIRIARP